MQNFKGDATELKYDGAAEPIMTQLSEDKDEFFDEAYACFVLGEVLYDSMRAPLANAIKREIFRESFSSIFQAFVEVGTFESYLTVFRNIFGDEVDVEFTVPAPGRLQINIEASDLILSNFAARYIEDNTYLFDTVVDDAGDKILFRTVKGFQSQYELEQMLFEMVPAGIFTEISLTVGTGG